MWYLTFRGIATFFLKQLHQFFISTSNVWRVPCLHILISTCDCPFFDNSYLSERGVVSHCGLDWHFPSCAAYHFMCILATYIFFGDNVYSNSLFIFFFSIILFCFAHMFNWVVCLFIAELQVCLYSGYQSSLLINI